MDEDDFEVRLHAAIADALHDGVDRDHIIEYLEMNLERIKNGEDL